MPKDPGCGRLWGASLEGIVSCNADCCGQAGGGESPVGVIGDTGGRSSTALLEAGELWESGGVGMRGGLDIGLINSSASSDEPLVVTSDSGTASMTSLHAVVAEVSVQSVGALIQGGKLRSAWVI